ncbi:hypothetical protein [Mycobacteroides abscessus]|nr:hypothetical protein [Mycobacteroides abscessus]
MPSPGRATNDVGHAGTVWPVALKVEEVLDQVDGRLIRQRRW